MNAPPPLTVQSVSVVVPPKTNTPPTAQSASESAALLYRSLPAVAELPLTVQSVRVVVWRGARWVGGKVIAWVPPSARARLTAWRRLRSPGGEPVPSMVVLTTTGLVWKAPMSGVGEASLKPRWSVVIG